MQLINFFLIIIALTGFIQPDNMSLKVLCYHQISPVADNIMTTTPALFEEQMKHLREKGYYPVGMEDAVCILSGREKIPGKYILITFDDGYDGIYKYAYPILKKYNYPASVFLVVSMITKNGKNGHLTWEQLETLRDSGLFYIGSHTYALHRKLPDELRAGRLSSFQLLSDLNKSRNVINEHLGIVTNYLSWPFGGYDDRTVEIAKKAGFDLMFTTDDGANHPGDSPLLIKRIRMSSSFDSVSRMDEKLDMFK